MIDPPTHELTDDTARFKVAVRDLKRPRCVEDRRRRRAGGAAAGAAATGREDVEPPPACADSRPSNSPKLSLG
jgi:hypothetical protein